MIITATRNEKKNGIELRFSEKPSAGILELVKQHGFRFSSRQKMWYAKQTPGNIAFAELLAAKECKPDAKAVLNEMEALRVS